MVDQPLLSPPLANLASLREKIDAIDSTIHAALVARGEVVAEVIAAKQAAGDVGSAFRPDREAALMRKIVLKNPGRWPLDAPENIWRVIVATSTYKQVPYAIHADISGGDVMMRESMRFHFGFTVPFIPQAGAEAVIAAVADSHGDLGMFRIDQGVEPRAWWRGLEAIDAPKIIARLPFAERADHPVPLPVFVIAQPNIEGLARENVLASLHLEHWRAAVANIFEDYGVTLIASAGDAQGAHLLIAHEAKQNIAELKRAFEKTQGGVARYYEIGCHAARFVLPS